MFAGLRKIAFKLAVLAGVPVIGVLLLSAEIAGSARDRARTADAIGTIEDLAELSARMNATVEQLQTERAMAALALGLRAAHPAQPVARDRADVELVAQEGKTDTAVAEMDEFLAQRDITRLPATLQGDLVRARSALEGAHAERQKVSLGLDTIAGVLDFYGSTNDSLINATAALTQLSNDGEMLRALSSLVALMHVQECESREHAVLSYTFAVGEFAPGLYRYLVTLVTEKSVHSATLQSFATASQIDAYRRALGRHDSERSAGMLQTALDATEDNFDIDANDWFEVQQSKVFDLAMIGQRHAERVREIARGKVAQTRRAVRYAEALVIGVVLVSVLLTLAIGRGITRSLLSLVSVAGQVQRRKDFSLRAQKTTRDEVGALTDAFNEMLTGIQDRDQELLSHRENLEQAVRDRTRELSKRNEDMRLVLDTVEQGLATLDESGCMSAERSRAFDSFFGPPEPNRAFFEHIAAGDSALSAALADDWSRITSAGAAFELALGEARSRIQLGQRHFTLAYKPLLENGELTRALLTVSDITAETAEAITRGQLEKELQLAQKLEGIGQLAAGVAHEINTPMQYIGDNIGFLLRAFEKLNEYMDDAYTAVSAGGASSIDEARARLDASKARLKLAYLLKTAPKALQDSKAGVEHVSNIVRAMKSFAHVDHDEKTTGDLNQALRDTLMVAQNEYKSVAVVETDLGELPSVLCFPGRLNQVFLNLIVNAAHAVADAKRESGGKIRVSSRADGGVVAVTISDNGVGIPEHIKQKVFDPFFTTKPVGKGTGQGLSLARSIVVDAHGGTLSFESEVGRGTAFTVRLPVDGHTQI